MGEGFGMLQVHPFTVHSFQFCSLVAPFESACSAGDPGSIPGSGRSPGGGHSNPLQYSRLENSMDRGALQATVHTVIKSNMNEVIELAHMPCS